MKTPVRGRRVVLLSEAKDLTKAKGHAVGRFGIARESVRSFDTLRMTEFQSDAP